MHEERSGSLCRTLRNQRVCGASTLQKMSAQYMCLYGPVHAVPDHVALVDVAAVEGHERLDHVAVGDDEARGEQDLRHVVEVLHRDEVLEAVDLPQRDRERQDHREAGVDRAGDEVRREDRRVPARDDAGGEVEGHDGVDRDDERRREAGEQQRGRLVALPVPRRAAPAHREHRRRASWPRASWPGRAASRDPGSSRRTRRAARPWRRSRPRRRPRSAGCGSWATCPSCWGRAAASSRATGGPCGAAG